jgi:hypothetical protein
MRITVVAVNHGTTAYAELLLSSLLRHHPDRADLQIVLLDNESPELDRLDRFRTAGVEIQQSGYSTSHTLTTHGEILRDAVLARPDCDAYLFVDCDVCFRTDDTIGGMAAELRSDSGLFAIQARWLNADGTQFHAAPVEPPPRSFIREAIRGSTADPWPEPLEYSVELRLADRVHPFCALLRNTPAFRSTVEHLGLSPAVVQSERGGRWWDTLGLLTQVMRTHGLGWRESEYGVLHFGNVSWDSQWAAEKAAARDRLLAEYP